jgi:hypothetical protein
MKQEIPTALEIDAQSDMEEWINYNESANHKVRAVRRMVEDWNSRENQNNQIKKILVDVSKGLKDSRND